MAATAGITVRAGAVVDLFRQTEIEAAVYEALTKQYELAKVQEAKEIPTIRVLDRPKVPEEKSFPPRLALIAAGTLLGLLAGLLRIAFRQFWTTADAGDPVKALALDIHNDTRAFWSRDLWRKMHLRRSHG